MTDPDPRDGETAGFSWRIKRSGDDGRFDLADKIAFEFADSEGTVVTSFSIPAETIDTLLRPHLLTFAELQLDGTISLDAELSSTFEAPPQKFDILQMVTDALAPEMLEDEPNAKEHLRTLRQRMEKVLALVDRTLAEFDKSSA